MADNDRSFQVVVALVVILGGLLYYRTHAATTFAADGMDADWDAAAQRSHDSGQPSVVLFTADWCGYCRSLHADVLSRSDVEGELEKHYSFYTVDMSHPSAAVQAHARKLHVDGFPLMIRYDANGQETARTYFLQPEEMMAWLKAGE